MNDQQLSKNFFLSEFIDSDMATRRGIPNLPSDIALGNIRQQLAPGMQRIRDLLQTPVVISSGYRSIALNNAVGGSPKSQHVLGQAADFTAPGFGTPKDIAIAIRESWLRFDQLIWEGTWVHVSFSEHPRREVLTATFKQGKAYYSQGIV